MTPTAVSSSSATKLQLSSKILDGWFRPITPNEVAWIEFIRLNSFDSDPAPTLKRVQSLRRVFSG